MDFNLFKTAISAQFAKLQQHKLFRVDISKDTLWETYLSSFPEGTNLIYRERREYDCSCCRQFIRTVGDVVAIVDGTLVSIWDVDIHFEPAFQTVTDTLAALVKSKPILEPFLHYERHAGTDRNFEQIAGSVKDIKIWTHFYVNINSTFVRDKYSIPSALSVERSTHDVLLRSLREISIFAINTTLDLIAQNSLYRGEEHQATLQQFLRLKTQFDTLPVSAQDLFAWSQVSNNAVSHIRNTAIGTLLVALSNGEDLETAVRSFEAIVAPANYKRPTSLITPAMVDKAKQTLTDLGLISALDRRFATPSDINVNNILFTDKSTKSPALADAFDDLKLSSSTSNQNFSKVEEITIDKFISDILPRIDSIELLFENRHANNLVSLIAPSDPTAPTLFKWDNAFSWSYAGEFADAIREKVKAAGGNVTGDLCCRLAWYNYDDLDLHMVEPSGTHIFFGCRRSVRTGGMLDVDMNVNPNTREPVENVFYSDRSRLLEGVYHLYVHQYNSRESSNTGFDVEIDYLGQVYRFSYQRPVRGGESITVAKFTYSHKEGFKLIDSESLPSSTSTRELWNIHTNTFHRVNLLTLSPNYWSSPVGNKHYFFMLDNCINDGSARGFYNEFLTEELNKHRKVFEVLASKTKPADSPTQLSGLGFSSTRNDSVICRVKGNFTRTIKVTF